MRLDTSEADVWVGLVPIRKRRFISARALKPERVFILY
jgi:hypothetical protein